MRQRVITAVIALIIFIPIIIAGGVWVDIAASVLGLIALSEILVMRKKAGYFMGGRFIRADFVTDHPARFLARYFARTLEFNLRDLRVHRVTFDVHRFFQESVFVR